MDRLKAVGISGNLLAFILNLVSSRELEANYGWLGLKDWTYKGLPQGSVLSPTVYSLYIAGLKSKINRNCKLLEYIDDLADCSVNRYSRICVSEVEESIQSIEPISRKVAWRWNKKNVSCVSPIKRKKGDS
jgi:retron-type reverse transcriptase